jgi:S1-C subfamily serine protease
MGMRFYRALMAVMMSAVLVLAGCQSEDSWANDLSENRRDLESADVITSNFADYLYQNVNGYDYETYVHRVSRNSAVRVQIKYPFGTIQGSGTYFKWKGHTMVVTAAHLYAYGGAVTMSSEALVTTPDERVLGRLVYVDNYVDVAIFAVPALESRRPARFNRADNFPIGEEVVYSGFPGANSLLTFGGTLAGDGYDTDISMHSFAWGGSSGSGVFNSRGEYVGVLVSIMVGPGFQGPQLVGSVVYIAPATLIDTALLRHRLDKLSRMKNHGF